MIIFPPTWMIGLLPLHLLLPSIVQLFPEQFLRLTFIPGDRKGENAEYFQDFAAFNISHFAAKSFYIHTLDSNDRIGVWHIGPCQHLAVDRMSNYSMTELNSGHPIFVYFHGNKRSRSARTRTSTYKRISSLGYHVIAFDYRGYGDSSGRMTGEKDCVQDSISVLKYVYEHKGSSPVYFYGHSLGTGVVGSVVAFLKSKGNATLTDISLPDGIVLDSAFTSLADAAIKTFPDWVYRILPLHKITQKLGVEFNSMKNLYGLQKPMLILHAEDDPTVPFNQGRQLAEHLQRQSPVTFVPFSAGRQLGHNSIYSVEEFAKILNQMVQLRNVTHSTTGNVNVCS